MNTNEYHSQVDYHPVYLSGLRPLMRIYREQCSRLDFLNTDFGLPLVQVSYHDEVVAFATAGISPAGVLSIRQFSKAGFDSEEIRTSLEQQATQELQLVLGAVQDTTRIQQQIERLVDWLNHTN